MEARSDIVAGVKPAEAPFDFEALFHAHYARIAGVIARVVRNPARAEELAVEVFLKLWRTPKAQGEKATGWLYRAAVRKALDELRRQTRRTRYERLLGFVRPPTPEELRIDSEEQENVRLVLSSIKPGHAELLLLHSHGFSYDELAATLTLHPASVGALLNRAQETFRKEYVRRYGNQY
jgi:RNA polymerase sigma-70 factor (ECF subfamily)